MPNCSFVAQTDESIVCTVCGKSASYKGDPTKVRKNCSDTDAQIALIEAGTWGDDVHQVLSMIGITSERVSGWLGSPCNCPERQQKLNRLHWWCKQILKGRKDEAKARFEQLLGDG